jgi:large subunit ribosomal protein L25
MESLAAQVKASDFKEFLSRHGRNSLFTAEFAAEEDFSMLIKDIQYDAVKKDIVHLDLQRVSLNEKVNAEVPVKVTGRTAVEKAGSVVAHQLNTVTVECLPQDVPQYVEADITGMTPGYSLTAAKLRLPRGVALLTKPNDVILSITAGGLGLKVHKQDEPVVPSGEEGDVHAERI